MRLTSNPSGWEAYTLVMSAARDERPLAAMVFVARGSFSWTLRSSAPLVPPFVPPADVTAYFFQPLTANDNVYRTLEENLF